MNLLQNENNNLKFEIQELKNNNNILEQNGLAASQNDYDQ